MVAQPHDPQPHAEGDAALHHLHGGPHPRHGQGGQVDQAGPPDLDGRPERQPLPGLRRPQEHRQQGQVHLPEPAGWAPTRAGARRTSGPSTATACWSPPPGHVHTGGLWTDMWVKRPGARYAGPRLQQARHGLQPAQVPQEGADRPRRQGPSLQVARQVLRAHRPRVVGRRDDRHARQLAGRPEEGRRARDLGHLRDRAGLAGTSPWESWWPTWPRARRARTPSARRSTTRARSRTATSRRTASTAARRPTCRTRASSRRACSPAGR